MSGPAIKLDIKIEQNDELKRLFKGTAIERPLARIVKRVAHETRIRMAVYPPEGEWNTPGPYPKRWYQRHVGPRWARKNGSIGGRNTSKQLQKNWQERISGKLSRDVFNDTPYAPLVQSADEQASFHAAHGWQTDEMVAEDVTDNVVDRIVIEEFEREGL